MFYTVVVLLGTLQTEYCYCKEVGLGKGKHFQNDRLEDVSLKSF